ncbi:hypothetical protein VT50_0203860 [Streptomyces antioxidans]|uniref:Uncharacterized protein n=1 Tax=Streptomyces antioxidans TaxID=1507734 RepID=A0A1V4DC64_9ACTN|nr:hypothetical protein [Streptomyces antioxidans]OPF83572.1 hypothetical protein VT50_0203860 [Streptomyces antioxidans]
MSKDKLSVSDQDLSDLIKDLEGMLSYLEEQIERLGQLRQSMDPDDHKGPAAAAYKKLERDAYTGAVRVRQLLTRIEEVAKERGESPGERYEELRTRFQSLQKPSSDGPPSEQSSEGPSGKPSA